MIKTPVTLQDLRRRLYVKAKAEPSGPYFSITEGPDFVDKSKKIRQHLVRASQRHGFGWKRWSKAWLYGTLGLFAEYRVAR